MDKLFKRQSIFCLAAISLLAVFVLAGCSTIPVTLTTDQITEQPRDFYLEGRISVQQEEDSSAGKMVWRHTSEADAIDLFSPFGQKVAEITREGKRYRVTDGNKLLAESENIAEVMPPKFTWPLPMNELPRWVLGIPARERSVQDPLPYTFNLPDGWILRYEAFDLKDGRLLPTKMQFSNQEVTIRLVIDRWELR